MELSSARVAPLHVESGVCWVARRTSMFIQNLHQSQTKHWLSSSSLPVRLSAPYLLSVCVVTVKNDIHNAQSWSTMFGLLTYYIDYIKYIVLLVFGWTALVGILTARWRHFPTNDQLGQSLVWLIVVSELLTITDIIYDITHDRNQFETCRSTWKVLYWCCNYNLLGIVCRNNWSRMW